MASSVAKTVRQGVLGTSNAHEARRNVIGLYRAWHRQIPYLVETFNLDVTVDQCRAKVHELFVRNANVTDVRVIDMLVVKGKLDLEEAVKVWKQKTHIMRFFEDPSGPKPKKDFMTRFLTGVD